MEANGTTSTEVSEHVFSSSQSAFNQHLTLFQTMPMSGYPACLSPWAELRNHPKPQPKRSETHSSWQVCVCEAQTCSQQLTGSPGTRSCFQVPPTEFLCFDSFPQPELFKPEQRRGISRGTSWGHSQTSTGLLQKPDLRKRQD